MGHWSLCTNVAAGFTTDAATACLLVCVLAGWEEEAAKVLRVKSVIMAIDLLGACRLRGKQRNDVMKSTYQVKDHT